MLPDQLADGTEDVAPVACFAGTRDAKGADDGNVEVEADVVEVDAEPLVCTFGISGQRQATNSFSRLVSSAIDEGVSLT